MGRNNGNMKRKNADSMKLTQFCEVVINCLHRMDHALGHIIPCWLCGEGFNHLRSLSAPRYRLSRQILLIQKLNSNKMTQINMSFLAWENNRTSNWSTHPPFAGTPFNYSSSNAFVRFKCNKISPETWICSMFIHVNDYRWKLPWNGGVQTYWTSDHTTPTINCRNFHRNTRLMHHDCIPPNGRTSSVSLCWCWQPVPNGLHTSLYTSKEINTTKLLQLATNQTQTFPMCAHTHKHTYTFNVYGHSIFGWRFVCSAPYEYHSILPSYSTAGCFVCDLFFAKQHFVGHTHCLSSATKTTMMMSLLLKLDIHCCWFTHFLFTLRLHCWLHMLHIDRRNSAIGQIMTFSNEVICSTRQQNTCSEQWLSIRSRFFLLWQDKICSPMDGWKWQIAVLFIHLFHRTRILSALRENIYSMHLLCDEP